MSMLSGDYAIRRSPHSRRRRLKGELGDWRAQRKLNRGAVVAMVRGHRGGRHDDWYDLQRLRFGDAAVVSVYAMAHVDCVI